jgi:transcriptional regulator with XRE-family HTH domain
MGSEDDDFDEADFRRRLGKHIGRVRASRGYSQDRLTDEAGLARGTLSKIERAITSPQVTTVARIAKILGVPLKKLTDVDV